MTTAPHPVGYGRWRLEPGIEKTTLQQQATTLEEEKRTLQEQVLSLEVDLAKPTLASAIASQDAESLETFKTFYYKYELALRKSKNVIESNNGFQGISASDILQGMTTTMIIPSAERCELMSLSDRKRILNEAIQMENVQLSFVLAYLMGSMANATQKNGIPRRWGR